MLEATGYESVRLPPLWSRLGSGRGGATRRNVVEWTIFDLTWGNERGIRALC